MSNSSNSGKFWPYMILGFLVIGITLGYWTVRNAVSLPVQESNAYLMKYQQADLNANEIQEAIEKFNKKYSVELSGLEPTEFKPKHIKRKPHKYVLLHKTNSFSYKITTKDGKVINDANVSVLLTRPDSDIDNILIKDIKGKDGIYSVQNLPVKHLGRYIIRAKIVIGKDMKFIDTYGVRKE